MNEMEDALHLSHRNRMEAEAEYSDLETELDNRHAMDKIGVLKQVVTDPDYVAR